MLRLMTETNKYKQIIELNPKPLLNIAVVISSFFMNDELEKLKDHCYRSIQISYNSDGIIMTKKELKPRIRTLILNKLDYALELLKYNTESKNYIKTLELKELLMNEKY